MTHHDKEEEHADDAQGEQPDAQSADKNTEPSQQQHHNAQTEEDTASGGPA